MSERGHVTFVGAGPGDPGLLPLRAQEVLARAQVVVADVDVAPGIVESVRENAERVWVAEDGRGILRGAVGAFLRARVAAGQRVVRLVAGDGGEFHGEPAALEVADLAFDVIPGVPARAAEHWLRRRPLHGRRVLVTRPRAQAGRLAALLEAQGAEVVALPTIRIEPAEDWAPLDEAIRGLGAFGWVLFTSVNGVGAFRDRLARAGLDARSLAGRRVAAIGPETGDALRRMGIEPDLVPTEFRAEGLLEALLARLRPEESALLVRAAEARDVLPRELRARGVRVTVVPAYRTVLATEGVDRARALLEARRVDVVTFTSSSTVKGFLALVPPDEARRLLRGVVVAAIGPITAETAAEHGLEVSLVPAGYTVPALAAAIVDHFEQAAPATLRG